MLLTIYFRNRRRPYIFNKPDNLRDEGGLILFVFPYHIQRTFTRGKNYILLQRNIMRLCKILYLDLYFEKIITVQA